ncbi:MAG: hypothetical protein DMF63_05455 [Acidobacteria bacterium]|nr:MAG: hypothetical protein DMF63_05455 [Acidobacteriota bacterium]
MKLDDSDWVNNLFKSTAEDWTPTTARDSAQVLFVPFSDDENTSVHCATVLSNAELVSADTFLNANDKNHFIQRRAFRKYCGARALGSTRALRNIEFYETDKGRPYLSSVRGLWFSFSSCQLGFLGAWSFTHGIGTDIEDQTRNIEATELAHEFFSENEARIVDEATDATRLRTFFNLWSLKESALKSIGEGLPFGLDAFEFDLSPDVHLNHAPVQYGGAGRFQAHLIERDNTCAALVTHLL